MYQWLLLWGQNLAIFIFYTFRGLNLASDFGFSSVKKNNFFNDIHCYFILVGTNSNYYQLIFAKYMYNTCFNSPKLLLCMFCRLLKINLYSLTQYSLACINGWGL